MRRAAQARDFEAQALAQLLATVFATVDTAAIRFSGGAAEAQWRPMLLDAMAAAAVRAGRGIGLAEFVLREMQRVRGAETDTQDRRDHTMMDRLILAGQRLAEALRAENEALAKLDLSRAARLGEQQDRRVGRLRRRLSPPRPSTARRRMGRCARRRGADARLEELGRENRRLLERAVSLQSRVIETIAGAALQRPGAARLCAGRTAAVGRRGAGA